MELKIFFSYNQIKRELHNTAPAGIIDIFLVNHLPEKEREPVTRLPLSLQAKF